MLHDSYDLDRFHPRKDGTCCLKAKIYRSRTDYIFISLKIYLHPTQWDGKKITHSVTAEVDNARLNNYRRAIGRLLLDIDESGDNPPMSDIRARVERSIGQKRQSPERFFDYYENYAAKIKTKSTRELFLYTLSKVRKFDPSIKSFTQITPSWLRDFKSYCEDTGMSVNGISVYMRNIRTVYKLALDDNIVQLNDYPFIRFRIRQEQTRKRALTIEQLRTLRDYPCTDAQRQYRDIFMLIFYLRGINIGDLLKLKTIEADGCIHYSRSKTRKPYTVKVEPEALDIIERYRGRDHLLSIGDRYGNHRDYTHRINDALQAIGAPPADKRNKSKPGPAPLDRGNGAFPGLTTYWARHSWASVAAGLDIPKETIAAGLGHGGNTVTDIYINFDTRKVDEANRKVLDAIL
jgi:site-specific recombinase XerD